MTPRRIFVAFAATSVALAACVGPGPGSPSSSQVTPPPQPPHSAGLTLTPPAGWANRVLPASGGIVLADTEADLTDQTPAGPRLTAVPNTAAPTADTLIANLDTSALFAPTATQQTFGQYDQVPVLRFTTAATPTEGETVEIVSITVAPNKAYLMTLEAPSSSWSTAQSTLEGVVASASINAELFPK
ncbi:hypothetical protein [Arthrobacter sp. MMS18-M83]|uniref:hypothetical protein n=1 Tax=Arthrobacter sp. MMS18-M83 TaxID=2996261 RepID=UPI00227CF9A8|nr:hypothetical protein [Arthrobacter sp. MMS18-M83]WAH99267.1 hypothetical protein OW521_10860 [Arthrobacter sp. MMS18-M83]